jgi:hypothetical protein
MGHQWARQMFPPPGKRQRVGLPLGSLVGTWDRAEPGVGGVSRPSRSRSLTRFGLFQGLLLCHHICGKGLALPPGGPRDHATCAGMPPRMAEPVSRLRDPEGRNSKFTLVDEQEEPFRIWQRGQGKRFRGGFGGWEGGSTCTCPAVWRLDAKRLVPDNPKLSEATLHPAGRQLSHAAWEAGGPGPSGPFLV